MPRKVFLSLLILLISPSWAKAQQCAGPPPEEFRVSGRVIVPIPGYDKYIEVLQLNEEQLIGYDYADGNGEYSLPPAPPGQYYIVVRATDLFKEYKERVTVFGCETYYIYNFFIDLAEPEPPAQLVLDFSGEVKEVVDISELKRTFPKKVVDEFERAREDRTRGEVQSALRRLEKIVEQAPDFYDAHNVLGTVYLELKRFRDAEQEYNIAHDLKPSSAAPLVSLGSLYMQEAEASVNPEPGLGVLLSENDLPLILDDARSVLEEAIRLKPDASFAYYLLGVAHYKTGRYALAESALKQALTLEARLRWTRIGLANLYMKQNKWAEAVAQFDAYLAEFPKVANRSEVEATRKKVLQLMKATSN